MWMIFNNSSLSFFAKMLITLRERIAFIKEIRSDECSYKMEIRSKKTLFHATKALSKEPHTIEWINKYFLPKQIIYDIGANVGMLSLYTASKIKEIDIFAFEPEALNFAQLNRNIYLNGYSELIHPFCIAITDQTKLGNMNIEQFRIGGSLHQFNRVVNHLDEEYEVQHIQGAIGFTLDDLISKWGLPVPNHIKIDVDGIEDLVIVGARKTLKNERLQSVQIEITDVGKRGTVIHNAFFEAGFKLISQADHFNLRTTDFLFAREEKTLIVGN